MLECISCDTLNDAFGQKEGVLKPLQDVSSRPEEPKDKPVEAFLPPTTNHITAVVHGAPPKDDPWETYIDKSEYNRATDWFREQKFSKKTSAEVVEIAAAASTPEFLSNLKRAGRAAADGCVVGVGSYGFDQMPGLIETIVVDGNSTAVAVLMNLDYANRYYENDMKAWDLMRATAEGEELLEDMGGGETQGGKGYMAFGNRNNYGLCPKYR